MVRAFITGITGQDGSYLTEYLLDRKYEVHGLIRPGCDISTTHVRGHARDIGLHIGDLADGEALLWLPRMKFTISEDKRMSDAVLIWLRMPLKLTE